MRQPVYPTDSKLVLDKVLDTEWLIE